MSSFQRTFQVAVTTRTLPFSLLSLCDFEAGLLRAGLSDFSRRNGRTVSRLFFLVLGTVESVGVIDYFRNPLGASDHKYQRTTIVSLRSFGSLHHGPHVWLLVRIYPDLGPLSCWLQKRSLAHFKLVAELVAGEFTPDIRTLTVIA